MAAALSRKGQTPTLLSRGLEAAREECGLGGLLGGVLRGLQLGHDSQLSSSKPCSKSFPGGHQCGASPTPLPHPTPPPPWLPQALAHFRPDAPSSLVSYSSFSLFLKQAILLPPASRCFCAHCPLCLEFFEHFCISACVCLDRDGRVCLTTQGGPSFTVSLG